MKTSTATRLRGYAANLSLLNLIGLNWLIFALWSFLSGSYQLGSLLVFNLGSAALSAAILHALGYFGQVYIFPRRGDLILKISSIPMAGVIQYSIMVGLFKSHLFPISDVWMICTPVAFLSFTMHYLLAWRYIRQGHKKMRVVLDLLPFEKAELLEDFENAGISGYIQILSVSELKESFVRQTENEIDQIVVSRGAAREFHDDAYLVRAHLAGISIVDRREISTDITERIKLMDSDSWSFVLTATRQTALLRAYSLVKVKLEPFIALILAVLLAPLMLIAGVAIKLTSPGPVFYRQLRKGYLGKPFYLVKFRSMRNDSESAGPQWACSGDQRITPIGQFLRNTRIDEIPQLWNVIRGEMSFFGPRPERPEFYQKLKEQIPLFSIRTIVRPGISGWAQVCAGYAASIEESMTKLEYDLYYIKHMSPRLDLLTLLKTFQVALMGSERAATKAVLRREHDVIRV